MSEMNINRLYQCIFVICAFFITVNKIQYYCHYNAVVNQKFSMEGV